MAIRIGVDASILRQELQVLRESLSGVTQATGRVKTSTIDMTEGWRAAESAVRSVTDVARDISMGDGWGQALGRVGHGIGASLSGLHMARGGDFRTASQIMSGVGMGASIGGALGDKVLGPGITSLWRGAFVHGARDYNAGNWQGQKYAQGSMDPGLIERAAESIRTFGDAVRFATRRETFVAEFEQKEQVAHLARIKGIASIREQVYAGEKRAAMTDEELQRRIKELTESATNRTITEEAYAKAADELAALHAETLGRQKQREAETRMAEERAAAEEERAADERKREAEALARDQKALDEIEEDRLRAESTRKQTDSSLAAELGDIRARLEKEDADARAKSIARYREVLAEQDRRLDEISRQNTEEQRKRMAKESEALQDGLTMLENVQNGFNGLRASGSMGHVGGYSGYGNTMQNARAMERNTEEMRRMADELAALRRKMEQI